MQNIRNIYPPPLLMSAFDSTDFALFYASLSNCH